MPGDINISATVNIGSTGAAQATQAVRGVSGATKQLTATQIQANVVSRQRVQAIQHLVFTRQKLTNENIKAAIGVIQLRDAEHALLSIHRARNQQSLQLVMNTFGYTMSIWGLTNGIGALIGVEGESAKEFNRMSKLMLASTAPMMLYINLKRMETMVNKEAALSYMVLASSMMFVFSLWGLISAETKKGKLAYGAMMGVTLALAAANFKLGASNIFVTLTEVAKKAAQTMGLAVPIILGATAVGLAGMYALLPDTPKAHTYPGEQRQITQTGPIFAHAGESIGKVTSPQTASGGNTIVVNSIVDGEIVDRSWSRQRDRDAYVA